MATSTKFEQPLDLMFLQDLSGSFSDDIYTVQTLVPDIVSTIRSYQADSRFGLASFVDKPVSPFGDEYYGDYVYQTDLALTTDEALLQSVVNSLSIYSGYDGPESQIEALMQLALRWEEVGYRIGPVRVAVIMTDAEYHKAGDYTGVPANNGDAILDGTPAGAGEDYPSESLLKSVLDSTDIYPVFAVSDSYGSGIRSYYEALVKTLGRGAVVELSSDSSDLIDALSAGLDKIVKEFNPDQDLTGTAGDDTIDAGGGNDTITGGAGDDSLDGGDGKDTIYGDDGDDTLDGGIGKDRMEGGRGSDTYYVDASKDVCHETDNLPSGSSGLKLDIDLGDNVDTVISSVKYTLSNYVENLTLTESTKKLAGTGNDLGNTIEGNSGANKLTGKAGDDTIDGKEGADKISGGTGADTFVFSNLAEGGIDTISDFKTSEGDKLAFDSGVFTSLASGIAAGNLVTAEKEVTAADADDYLLFETKAGKLYYDADGNGAGTAVLVASIKKAADIDFADFTVVAG